MHATDKDIFDLLVASEKRLTAKNLRDVATTRGIICSRDANREDIAEYLSQLYYDHEALSLLIERSQSTAQREKTTSGVLPLAATSEELKEFIDKYAEGTSPFETVRLVQRTEKALLLSIDYEEFDYSRNTLTQRQKKRANFEFRIQGSEVQVRHPSTQKAKQIISDIKKIIESERRKTIEYDEISLENISHPRLRTQFFLDLIQGIPGYSLRSVTGLRVSSFDTAHSGGPDEDAAQEEMLSVVRRVSLYGDNLVASSEYNRLREAGFYITSVTWQVTRDQPPFDLVRFEAGFEDHLQASGFRYSARVADRSPDGTYPSTTRAPDAVQRSFLFEALEQAARRVMDSVRQSAVQPSGSGETA